MKIKFVPLALLLPMTIAACAQMPMPMDHEHMDEQMHMPEMQPDAMRRMAHPATLIDQQLNRTASGTSAEPASTPASMIMGMHGGWMLMLHGLAFVADMQQSGPRGTDKLFSTNWIMPMAQRPLGRGQITLRTMLSAEPATVTGRYYPELFQQGETAYGRPIVDGQHPHDFLMELAAIYDLQPTKNTLVSLYAAPVGDPAIGPTAYPHRWSASEDPIAALGHHQQDSTHIAFNVLTAGATYKGVRVEASGFHGAEPDESRWAFQPSPNGHAIDSWSTRLTINPARNWSGQYSVARIASPEALHPGENQNRQTASAMYNLPLGSEKDAAGLRNLSISAIWGRTKSLSDSSKENSYLLEALYAFGRGGQAWTRMENAGRSNELLDAHTLLERPIGHVAAYTFGYSHEFLRRARTSSALGAQVTTYAAPASLASAYGTHPAGVQVFLRVRLVGK